MCTPRMYVMESQMLSIFHYERRVWMTFSFVNSIQYLSRDVHACRIIF